MSDEDSIKKVLLTSYPLTSYPPHHHGCVPDAEHRRPTYIYVYVHRGTEDTAAHT